MDTEKANINDVNPDAEVGAVSGKSAKTGADQHFEKAVKQQHNPARTPDSRVSESTVV